MRQFPFYPLLLALHPVLVAYAGGADILHHSVLVVPALISVSVAAVLLVVLMRVNRDIHAGALAAAGVVISTFGYGILSSATVLRELPLLALPHVRLGVYLLAIIMILYLAHALPRTKVDRAFVSRVMNVVSTVLVLVCAVGCITNGVEKAAETEGIPGQLNIPRAEDMARGRELPDIYYIILDGYARNDVLLKLYGYDNSDFLDWLRSRGFYVAENSAANYCQTYLSVASSLNSTYLQPLTASLGQASQDRRPLLRLIQDNAVTRILRQCGYQVVSVSSGYTGMALKGADCSLRQPFWPDEFSMTIMSSTPLPDLCRVAGVDPLYTVHRHRIQFNLRNLHRYAGNEKPLFLFAHIICPHPPFVFGADGEALTPDIPFSLADASHWLQGRDVEEYRAGYRAQLSYLNEELRASVLRIIAASRRPVIIVLQADHGPGSSLEWENVERGEVVERLGILNAIYYSKGPVQGVYPGVTPVNTFRVLLSGVLGARTPLLLDRCYMSQWSAPYNYTDVTDQLGI